MKIRIIRHTFTVLALEILQFQSCAQNMMRVVDFNLEEHTIDI